MRIEGSASAEEELFTFGPSLTAGVGYLARRGIIEAGFRPGYPADAVRNLANA